MRRCWSTCRWPTTSSWPRTRRARTATVSRGIPTTLNTPALDPVLMYDGRQQNLDAQAKSAILDHAGGTRMPSAKELERIAEFERTRPFFSSKELWDFAVTGKAPSLPTGARRRKSAAGRSSKTSRSARATQARDLRRLPQRSDAERDQRVHPGPAAASRRTVSVRSGLGIERHRQSRAGLRVREPGWHRRSRSSSPDPGRALVTGRATREDLNAFKIPTLWGCREPRRISTTTRRKRSRR